MACNLCLISVFCIHFTVSVGITKKKKDARQYPDGYHKTFFLWYLYGYLETDALMPCEPTLTLLIPSLKAHAQYHIEICEPILILFMPSI